MHKTQRVTASYWPASWQKNPNKNPNPNSPKVKEEKKALGKQTETREDKSCDPLALLFAV